MRVSRVRRLVAVMRGLRGHPAGCAGAPRVARAVATGQGARRPGRASAEAPPLIALALLAFADAKGATRRRPRGSTSVARLPRSSCKPRARSEACGAVSDQERCAPTGFCTRPGAGTRSVAVARLAVGTTPTHRVLLADGGAGPAFVAGVPSTRTFRSSRGFFSRRLGSAADTRSAAGAVTKEGARRPDCASADPAPVSQALHLSQRCDADAAGAARRRPRGSTIVARLPRPSRRQRARREACKAGGARRRCAATSLRERRPSGTRSSGGCTTGCAGGRRGRRDGCRPAPTQVSRWSRLLRSSPRFR